MTNSVFSDMLQTYLREDTQVEEEAVVFIEDTVLEALEVLQPYQDEYMVKVKDKVHEILEGLRS